jgi:hypothetical protein
MEVNHSADAFGTSANSAERRRFLRCRFGQLLPESKFGDLLGDGGRLDFFGKCLPGVMRTPASPAAGAMGG